MTSTQQTLTNSSTYSATQGDSLVNPLKLQYEVGNESAYQQNGTNISGFNGNSNKNNNQHEITMVSSKFSLPFQNCLTAIKNNIITSSITTIKSILKQVKDCCSSESFDIISQHYLSSLLQIVKTALDDKEDDKAIELLIFLDELTQPQFYPHFHSIRITALIFLAHYFRSASNDDQSAFQVLEQALGIANAHGSAFLKGLTYLNLGSLLSKLNDNTQAIKFFQASVMSFEEANNSAEKALRDGKSTKKSLAYSYGHHNLSLALHNLGIEYEKEENVEQAFLTHFNAYMNARDHLGSRNSLTRSFLKFLKQYTKKVDWQFQNVEDLFEDPNSYLNIIRRQKRISNPYFETFNQEQMQQIARDCMDRILQKNRKVVDEEPEAISSRATTSSGDQNKSTKADSSRVQLNNSSNKSSKPRPMTSIRAQLSRHQSDSMLNQTNPNNQSESPQNSNIQQIPNKNNLITNHKSQSRTLLTSSSTKSKVLKYNNSSGITPNHTPAKLSLNFNALNREEYHSILLAAEEFEESTQQNAQTDKNAQIYQQQMQYQSQNNSQQQVLTKSCIQMFSRPSSSSTRPQSSTSSSKLQQLSQQQFSAMIIQQQQQKQPSPREKLLQENTLSLPIMQQSASSPSGATIIVSQSSPQSAGSPKVALSRQQFSQFLQTQQNRTRKSSRTPNTLRLNLEAISEVEPVEKDIASDQAVHNDVNTTSNNKSTATLSQYGDNQQFHGSNTTNQHHHMYQHHNQHVLFKPIGQRPLSAIPKTTSATSFSKLESQDSIKHILLTNPDSDADITPRTADFQSSSLGMPVTMPTTANIGTVRQHKNSLQAYQHTPMNLSSQLQSQGKVSGGRKSYLGSSTKLLGDRKPVKLGSFAKFQEQFESNSFKQSFSLHLQQQRQIKNQNEQNRKLQQQQQQQSQQMQLAMYSNKNNSLHNSTQKQSSSLGQSNYLGDSLVRMQQQQQQPKTQYYYNQKMSKPSNHSSEQQSLGNGLSKSIQSISRNQITQNQSDQQQQQQKRIKTENSQIGSKNNNNDILSQEEHIPGQEPLNEF